MKKTLTNVIMENPNKSVDDIYRIMRQRGYMIKKENVLKLINELKVIPFMPLIPTQQSLNDAEFMTAQLVDYAHNQIFANIARANELYDFTTDDLNVLMDEYFADSFEFAGKYGNNSNEFKLVETVVGSWLIGDINGNPYTLPSGREETLGSYYVDMIPRPFITESMDFVTFINTGTNTSEYIAFRGSKTDFSEASMEDWKTNALAFFDEGLAKQSNSFIRARENLKQVLRLYGKPRQFLGYSKGAWLAMLFGEEFSIPTITFNPFFSGLRNIIKDWKQNHTIYRTTEDVASSGLGWAKKSENLVIRNINALSRNVGAILAHKMDNFLDMLSPRLNQPKIASVVEEVNVASHRLKEIELIDLIQERLSSRNADDYGTFENLSQELDDGGGVFAREELRRPGADRVLRSSRLPGPKNRLYALEDPPDYGDTQKKLSFQEEAAGQTRISAKTRFVIVFNRVARALGFKGVDDRYERLVKTSSLGEYEPIQGITDRIYLSGKEILNYLKMPPIDKEAFKTSLKSGIRLATQTFNKLIEPFNRVNNSYFDTMKSEVFSVRNIGVGFGGGLVIGAITNAILANTPLANINPGALAFLSGAITGGVTESIISRFTFVSPAQVSASAMMGWTNFARIGSSAVSLGGGMVAGYYTTQALKQSGAGNVTANVVGGLASVGAGVAISGVASGLATVAGLEAWNPLGWFAGLGAIIAVGIGAIIGVMEDNGEIRMNKEIDYVLKSDSLANQYEYIIDQVGLLGTKPEIILGLQRDLQERQKNPNVMPLSPAEFQNLMNSIITSYSITDLEGTINAQRSTLYNTAQKLGYTDYIPPSYIQSPQNYVDEFNMLVMRGGQRAIDMGFTIKPTPSHTEITPIPPGDVEGFHRDELLAITASMNEQLARLEAERMERMRIAGAIQAQTPMPLANETAIANATNEPVIPPPYLTDVPEQPRQLSETDIRSQVRDALLLRQTAQMDSALSDLEIAKSQTTNANVLAGYQRRIRQLQFEHLDQLNTVRTADLNQQSADAIINNLSNLDSLNLDTEQLGTGGKLRQTYRDNVANKLGILSKQGAPVIPEPTPIPAPKAPAPTPTPEQISDALYGSNMFIP